MNPSVAIIIVNYNGFEDTAECIRSIRDCSYDNYEIVVVDNASSVEPEETTINYIKDNSVYFKADSNNGFSAGNNIGIKWALKNKYDYCLLINNDTTVDKEFLTRLLNAFNMDEKAGIVGGRICFYSDKNRIWYGGGHIDYMNGGAQHEYWGQTIPSLATVREVQFITGCLMLISADVLKKVGLLDESFFLYEEDLDYCLRVSKLGYKLFYVDNAIIYHKVSASTKKSTTMKSYYEIRNKLILTKRYFDNVRQIHLNIMFKCLKDCVRKRRPYRAVIMAFIDYYRGIGGKKVGDK